MEPLETRNSEILDNVERKIRKCEKENGKC